VNTSVLSKRIAGESLRPKARTAGVLFLLSVGTALVGEFLLHGSANIAAGLVAVVCYLGVTLLFYSIFKAVTRTLALLAVSFNLLGLVLEALRLEPGGVNVAMVLHGLYCLLMGLVIFRSGLLPRILGVAIIFAGVVWLANLSPSLADSLANYVIVAGILGEGLLPLWILFAGMNVKGCRPQSDCAGFIRN